MAERKMHNFESKILKKETIEKFGYDPDILGRASAKLCVCICRFCGEKIDCRKGFFIKSGSACHKECRLKEQSFFGSPFANKETREKAKQTNLKRYGVENANQNKEIGNKISKSKLTIESKNKTKQTNLERYGVENVFQSKEIKEKIKQTNLERYNVDHPQKSDEIRTKTIETLKEKYGIENLAYSKEIVEKRIKTLKINISEDKTEKHKALNTLRDKAFWNFLEENKPSLIEACNKFNVEYSSIAARLSCDEFKSKFREIYTYPKRQSQNEIKDFIVKLGFDVDCDIRTIISPFELDLYIENKKFAIEYNGSYWHSEAVLSAPDARNKHYNKTKLCREKEIRLFHIFEHTWLNRKKQILNFIRTILEKNEIKIGARECSVTNDRVEDFIEENHIQGYGNRTIRFFNLVSNGLVVASMTASSHHRQNIDGNPIVLNRLCFRDNYSVPGGSSRLFKSFILWAKKEGYDRVISWSDNCWTEGNIYRILGFSLKNEYGPDYFYWNLKNKNYISKQSCSKNKIGCPKEITERDWCFYNGLYRIWNCGKKKWEYIL